MSLHSLPKSPKGSSGKQETVSPQNVDLPYHAQPIGACLALLKTTLQGLTREEAELRNREALQSKKREHPRTTTGKLFLGSLKRKISLLFIAAAGLSFAMGEAVDGILILVALLVSGGIQGLIQWKSMQGQASMSEQANIRCVVRRNGESITVQADELGLGDILVINAGQEMPADARLVSSTQLQVDESALTGESVLVPKNANDILHPAEDVTALSNMLFAGTLVKTGKGEAIVTALGSQSMMGRIASIGGNTEKRESPFTKRLNQLSLKVFLCVLLMMTLVIGIGLYRHMPITQLIQIGLIMAISAFPETVPGLASLILSVSMGRLNKKKVLVKNFQALETIGDLSIICTDKTGTLTENYLLLDQLFLPGLGAIQYDPQWQTGQNIPCKSVEEFLRIGRLNNGTMVEGLRSALMGDPIDVALYRAAPASLEAGYHQRLSIPFDPVTLRSATLCETPDGQIVSMIKGAPESVLETCRFYLMPDGTLAEITLNQRSEFLMMNRTLAYENNLRVVGFAQKPMLDNDDSGPYANAIFIGWVCLMDPPKPGVQQAINALLGTGAKLIMITGDQKATAEITARELGLIRKKSDEVWLRSDLEAWNQPTIPDTVKVFARTKPEEKLAIVQSLQQGQQVVAMIGDGVNDAPALQKSDVAIAMGLQGAEAAKESADIILLNDRLEGILHAILESRISRRKIQSCMRYLLSCNLGMLLFVTVSTISGFGLPLTVVQLLWLNLIIISIPAMVLAIEPTRAEADFTPSSEEGNAPAKQWQYKKQETSANETTILDADPLAQGHLFLIAYWGVLIMASSLGAYAICAFLLKTSPMVAGTAAFCTMAISQTFNLFNVQALNAGVHRRDFMKELSSTPITWLVIGVALLLQAITIYTPVLNTIMGTTPLPLVITGIPLLLGLGGVLFSLKTMRL